MFYNIIFDMSKKFQGDISKKERKVFTIKNRWVKRLLLIFSPVFLMVIYILCKIGLALVQSPQPQLLLVLGGSPDREEFTAIVSKEYSTLDIWVSSGTQDSEKIFREAGLPSSKVHLDCRATDTVTNFTTVVEDLKNRNIRHVYIITSEYHMPRSLAIAAIVFGSQGIAFTPLSSPSNKRYPEVNNESRILRDVSRSIIWMFTGNALDDLNGRKNLDFCKNPGYERGIKG